MIRLRDLIGDFQYAFLVVKPGSLDHTSEIINIYRSVGWQVERIRTTRLLESQARKLYDVHKDEDFFEDLVKYMSSDRSTAILLKRHGDNSENYLKEVAAIKDDIRKRWGESDMRNVLHSTDDPKRLKAEAGIYF